MRNPRTRPEILAVILLTACSSARAETDALDGFNAEYPTAARRFEARFGTVKGSCRLRVVGPDGSKPATTGEADFNVDHGREKVAIRREVPGRGAGALLGEFVYSVESAAGSTFYLTRAPGADSYLVEGDGTSALDRSAYVTLFGRFVNAHHGVFGQPLARLMRTPGFRVVDAEYVTEAGARLVKARFEVGSRDPKSTVTMVFDPQDGWNVRSSDFRTGITPGVRITTEVTYGPSRTDGFRLPSRVVSRDGSGTTSVCEFVDWIFEPTPEAEFEMSFYDVTAPVDLPGSRKTMYVYAIAGAAAAAFAAGLALRRRGSRSAG